ncbi:MAG: hypothetical protein JST00_17885 [Deltaproteobacteria bacterium]|nr:hypothetical protein [Deltaproteobacteria bacterium]
MKRSLSLSAIGVVAAALAFACVDPRSDPASPGLAARPPGEPALPPPPLPLPDASRQSAIHHVLGTGQSLAVGAFGAPPLSTTQPFGNLMFEGGVLATASGLSSFVPLVEGVGSGVETMSSAFANLVSSASTSSGGAHDLLVSVHAVGGAPYRVLAKGTPPYALGLEQVRAGRRLASERGLAYDVSAVTCAHGAADHTERNARYAEDVVQWQRDYEADVKAITGQTTAIPFFHTQYSSFSIYDATSAIPAAQLRAHVDAPGKVILVGPRYPLLYGPDGVHLTNEGYRLMGEYYAKAYRRVVVERGTWEPVRPKTITRTGAVVTIRMHVPAPPLVLDTTRASDPGSYGFEWADDGPATPTISGVSVTAPDEVSVTLSATPTGGNRRIRYAFTGVKGAAGGLRTGPRGNLRDSDATLSRHGYELFNWCVHFDEPAP